MQLTYVLRKMNSTTNLFVRNQTLIHPYLKSALINSKIEELKDIQH